MRHLIIITLTILLSAATAIAQQNQGSRPNTTHQYTPSPTEGVIDHRFIPEAQMKKELLEMVARFMPYVKGQFMKDTRPNSLKDSMGGFRCHETMTASEDGIRTTADLGMVCSFMWKYGRKYNIELPDSMSYDELYRMGKLSLTFTYSTHKNNTLSRCRDGRNWGSTVGQAQFESSLWAMSMAYQAFFLWDSLSNNDKLYVQRALESECNMITSVPIRCQFSRDTRAEENGWDVDALAAYIGLFPDNNSSKRYFEQLRKLSINTLSHSSDKTDNTVIDSLIDKAMVKHYYVGDNLFPDYTLQNHYYFHPGYQNVVIQELGEAALALKIFQTEIHGKEQYRTNALFHNCKKVQDSVLHQLALPDGELAMPNGNDWSMFLFDQITTYSTMACFLRDPDALMLENQAFKNIKARQQTTGNGTWLLNSDIGARRMGVQAHRVIMTFLMHEYMSTFGMKPTKWQDFNKRHYEAKLFRSQNVIRASSPFRYMIFSQSGRRNYSGYFVPNDPGYSKIIIPEGGQNVTGNFLGKYMVEGSSPNAANTTAPTYELDSNSFVMNCEYSVNSYYLYRRHALYCTPGNAIISMDMTRNANGNHVITEERCGEINITFDPFTSTRRMFYHEGGADTVWNDTEWQRASRWVNIDNKIGIINRSPNITARLGKEELSSSINIRKLATSYSGKRVPLASMQKAGRHCQVYLSKITAEETARISEKTFSMDTCLTDGWMGLITSDSRGTYVIVSNLFGQNNSGKLTGFPIPNDSYFPAMKCSRMEISGGKVNADFELANNRSMAMRAGFMVKGNEISVRYISKDTIVVTANKDTELRVAYSDPETAKLYEAGPIKMKKYQALPIAWTRKKIKY